MTIAQNLKDHMAARKISQSDIARALGISAAAVNQYLQGKYAGNSDNIDVKAAAYLQREADKAREKKLDIAYVDIPSARRAAQLIKIAHQEGEAVVLYGQAGLGKTRALKEYRAANPDAILIETDPGYTAKELLRDIAGKINVDTRGSLHDLSEAIIAKLADTGRLIMVDEAELLPLRALECLRRIHDKAGIGLVLAGMPRLLINLRGKRGELVQLYSRVGFALNLGDALEDSEMHQIAQSVFADADADALAEMVAASRGNTRRLCKLMSGVARMARINDAAPDKAMVRQFAQMLIH